MRMAELAADLETARKSDAGFDIYRLEAITTDLRGHHPSEINYERLSDCVEKLTILLGNVAQKEVAK